MAIATRELYFETGLEVLSELGVGGLKLAEVCTRVGVTTGSFYHYFSSWKVYTHELITYWRNDRTLAVIEALRQLTDDPRERFVAGIQPALSFPHKAEAAIRAWSSVDPYVLKVQTEVDQQRFNYVYELVMELVDDPRKAEAFAKWCIYTLIGFEQSTLPRDPAIFEWIILQTLDTLESGVSIDLPSRSGDDSHTRSATDAGTVRPKQLASTEPS